MSSGGSVAENLGRRVATLGRARGRQMIHSLRELNRLLPTPAAAAAVGQDFENIRYKVGQSSFYLLSDGADSALGRLPRLLPPAARYGRKQFKGTDSHAF